MTAEHAPAIWQPTRRAIDPGSVSRRVLCVSPRYTHSFGTFDHSFPLLDVKAFMPPQGLLLVAAYLPSAWQVRWVDENVRPVTDDDLDWAEVVLLSGMHVQHEQITRLAARAQSRGRLVVLGGPSVSACPQWYADVDLLHVGEIGDATDSLFARLAARVDRPERQEVYRTEERRPLTELPVPAYRLLDLRDYFLASVQFSSGCPYRCEFCDIPELYGRTPRMKSPHQVTSELDAMLARGNPGAVYFVDDNFIANPHAARPLLETLVDWQRARGYPVEFACEATLNIAKRPELLRLMREAYFTTVFCGIETPEDDALRAMHKTQNLRSPILDAVRTLNSYGLEVVSGIIVGLDSDTEESPRRIIEFIEASAIPVLTINMLHALPRTPLWRRLAADGRILDDAGGRESNVRFLLPYETVEAGWRECLARAYTPEAIYRRFDEQLRATYPNRLSLPVTGARLNLANLRRAALIMARIGWQVGVRADYRRRFWRTALPTLRAGRIEDLIHVAIVAHHMILFARECLSGTAEKAFYSPGVGLPADPAEDNQVATATMA